MKTEDALFEKFELPQRGFQAKRKMAADKLQKPLECLDCGSDNVGLPANYDSLVDSVKALPAQEPEREALKLALEALESSRVFVTTREKIKHPEGTKWYDERITAIKEALAQPAQEPVAYVTGMSFGRFIVEPINRAMVLPVGMALYSAPQGKT